MSDKLHHNSPTTRQHVHELRGNPTPAESKLWAALRGRQMSYKFRQQHPIGRYIVDFYCHTCQLVVEVDGDSHAEQVAYDQQRTAWLMSQGCTVLRFTNQEVLHSLEGLVEVIVAECDRLSNLSDAL